MNILVTGAAGFIGAAFIKKLLQIPDAEYNVIGLDNINDYYNPELKLKRLEQLGIFIPANVVNNRLSKPVSGFNSDKHNNFSFFLLDLNDEREITQLFENEKFDTVIHLAAQAGVRKSKITNKEYIKNNINGFVNILENCVAYGIKHLVYASSSSVYGLNSKIPFSEHDEVSHPASLYAATKKSNELLAHAYSSLYNLPTTGLRFFTVYGPWGRPDMSPLLFIDSIMNDKLLKVFNNGEMYRDFTYIDDIVEGIFRIMNIIPKGEEFQNSENPDPASSNAPYRIYNIGNSDPVKILDYIECIEDVTGKKANLVMMPMQPGDVVYTYADSSELSKTTGFSPNTPLKQGIKNTFDWYKTYDYLLQ